MVATSNFLNVTGGLVAVVVFYFVTFALQTVFGLTLTSKDAGQSEAALRDYIAQLAMAERIPPMLFISASLITAVVLVLLCWQRPDFLLRALSWLRIPAQAAEGGERRQRAGQRTFGVATNCERLDQWMHVVAVIDRFMRFVPHDVAAKDDAFLARFAHWLRVSLGSAAADRSAPRADSGAGRSHAAAWETSWRCLWPAAARAEEGAASFASCKTAAPCGYSAGVLRRVSESAAGRQSHRRSHKRGRGRAAAGWQQRSRKSKAPCAVGKVNIMEANPYTAPQADGDNSSASGRYRTTRPTPRHAPGHSVHRRQRGRRAVQLLRHAGHPATSTWSHSTCDF